MGKSRERDRQVGDGKASPRRFSGFSGSEIRIQNHGLPRVLGIQKDSCRGAELLVGVDIKPAQINLILMRIFAGNRQRLLVSEASGNPARNFHTLSEEAANLSDSADRQYGASK